MSFGGNLANDIVIAPSAKADGFPEQAWHYNTYIPPRTLSPSALENYLSTKICSERTTISCLYNRKISKVKECDDSPSP